MRDSEDNERLKKYPKTTIRVRMPDHTIIQAVFQSKERGRKKNKLVMVRYSRLMETPLLVSVLYDFVRSLLETADRKFVLCLPPRTKLIEPTLTLFKAGLSPASNVLFAWIENGEKGIRHRNALCSVFIITFFYLRPRFKARISRYDTGFDTCSFPSA